MGNGTLISDFDACRASLHLVDIWDQPLQCRLLLCPIGTISHVLVHFRRSPLQFEDIWDLPPDDQVDRLSATFRPIWQEQLHRHSAPSLVSSRRMMAAMLTPWMHWQGRVPR